MFATEDPGNQHPVMFTSRRSLRRRFDREYGGQPGPAMVAAPPWCAKILSAVPWQTAAFIFNFEQDDGDHREPAKRTSG